MISDVAGQPLIRYSASVKQWGKEFECFGTVHKLYRPPVSLLFSYERSYFLIISREGHHGCKGNVYCLTKEKQKPCAGVGIVIGIGHP
jgi:hypothetical protein